jgi:restriction system protein
LLSVLREATKEIITSVGGTSLARKDEGFFDDLFEIFCIVQSWIGPFVAAVLYSLFRWTFPLMIGAQHTLVNSVFTSSAPWVGALTLLAWLLSLVFKWNRRHLFDQQRDLESIRALSWQKFEHLVGEIYRRQGYMVAEHGGPSADGGYDLSVRRDGQRKLVQCKHWKTQKVGVSPVRELLGVVAGEKAQGGIFVTTGIYTRDAENWARGKSTELVNGAQLWQLVKEINGIPADDKPPSTPNPLPVAAPSEQSAPPCPKCGGPTMRRLATRGPKADREFWGCKAYPRCKGSVDIDVA